MSNKMKVLFTGFVGRNNPSQFILENSSKEKIIFKNSYNEIDKTLKNLNLENYDLIIMLGLRNNLKKSIRIETTALINENSIATNLNFFKLNEYFKTYKISCLLNDQPTNYLCNYAYYEVLKRNRNTIFIHLPKLKDILDLDKLKNLILNIDITTCI